MSEKEVKYHRPADDSWCLREAAMCQGCGQRQHGYLLGMGWEDAAGRTRE